MTTATAFWAGFCKGTAVTLSAAWLIIVLMAGVDDDDDDGGME